MKIYIDSINFKCHTTNPDGTFLEVETPFFDGKCDTYIEGYCYEIKENSVTVYPWKPYDELENAQRKHEKQKLNEYNLILQELGVET